LKVREVQTELLLVMPSTEQRQSVGITFNVMQELKYNSSNVLKKLKPRRELLPLVESRWQLIWLEDLVLNLSETHLLQLLVQEE
jgi:hypothetical protein